MDPKSSKTPGVRVHSWTPAPPVGETFDCGWAIGVLHADDTVSRRCKGCGVTVRSAVIEGPHGVGEVVPVPINHAEGCLIAAIFTVIGSGA